MHRPPRTAPTHESPLPDNAAASLKPNPQRISPSVPAMPHLDAGVVGGKEFSDYHVETVPCTRNIRHEELNSFQANPAKLVGNKFAPRSTEDVWEVTEVRFSKDRGWSSLVQFEGSDDLHKMDLGDFLGMLGSGSVQFVEQE